MHFIFHYQMSFAIGSPPAPCAAGLQIMVATFSSSGPRCSIYTHPYLLGYCRCFTKSKLQAAVFERDRSSVE